MRRRRSGRGQSLVEFAMVLPVFVFILVGLFDVGRAVYAFNTISNAARESARVAIVNQTTADVQGEALQQGVSLGISAADVTISYLEPNGAGTCTGNVDLGCVATITVQYTFTAATPLIGQVLGPLTMSSTTAMPVERTCPDSTSASLLTCPWP